MEEEGVLVGEMEGEEDTDMMDQPEMFDLELELLRWVKMAVKQAIPPCMQKPSGLVTAHYGLDSKSRWREAVCVMMILAEPFINQEGISKLGRQMAQVFRQDCQLWEVKAKQLARWVERGLLNVKLLDRTLAYFQNQSSFLQYIKTLKRPVPKIESPGFPGTQWNEFYWKDQTVMLLMQEGDFPEGKNPEFCAKLFREEPGKWRLKMEQFKRWIEKGKHDPLPEYYGTGKNCAECGVFLWDTRSYLKHMKRNHGYKIKEKDKLMMNKEMKSRHDKRAEKMTERFGREASPSIDDSLESESLCDAKYGSSKAPIPLQSKSDNPYFFDDELPEKEELRLRRHNANIESLLSESENEDKPNEKEETVREPEKEDFEEEEYKEDNVEEEHKEDNVEEEHKEGNVVEELKDDNVEEEHKEDNLEEHQREEYVGEERREEIAEEHVSPVEEELVGSSRRRTTVKPKDEMVFCPECNHKCLHSKIINHLKRCTKKSNQAKNKIKSPKKLSPKPTIKLSPKKTRKNKELVGVQKETTTPVTNLLNVSESEVKKPKDSDIVKKVFLKKFEAQQILEKEREEKKYPHPPEVSTDYRPVKEDNSTITEPKSTREVRKKKRPIYNEHSDSDHSASTDLKILETGTDQNKNQPSPNLKENYQNEDPKSEREIPKNKRLRADIQSDSEFSSNPKVIENVQEKEFEQLSSKESKNEEKNKEVRKNKKSRYAQSESSSDLKIQGKERKAKNTLKLDDDDLESSPGFKQLPKKDNKRKKHLQFDDQSDCDSLSSADLPKNKDEKISLSEEKHSQLSDNLPKAQKRHTKGEKDNMFESNRTTDVLPQKSTSTFDGEMEQSYLTDPIPSRKGKPGRKSVSKREKVVVENVNLDELVENKFSSKNDKQMEKKNDESSYEFPENELSTIEHEKNQPPLKLKFSRKDVSDQKKVDKLKTRDLMPHEGHNLNREANQESELELNNESESTEMKEGDNIPMEKILEVSRAESPPIYENAWDDSSCFSLSKFTEDNNSEGYSKISKFKNRFLHQSPLKLGTQKEPNPVEETLKCPTPAADKWKRTFAPEKATEDTEEENLDTTPSVQVVTKAAKKDLSYSLQLEKTCSPLPEKLESEPLADLPHDGQSVGRKRGRKKKTISPPQEKNEPEPEPEPLIDQTDEGRSTGRGRGKKMIPCPLCGAEYAIASNLEKHIDKDHKDGVEHKRKSRERVSSEKKKEEKPNKKRDRKSAELDDNPQPVPVKEKKMKKVHQLDANENDPKDLPILSVSNDNMEKTQSPMNATKSEAESDDTATESKADMTLIVTGIDDVTTKTKPEDLVAGTTTDDAKLTEYEIFQKLQLKDQKSDRKKVECTECGLFLPTNTIKRHLAKHEKITQKAQMLAKVPENGDSIKNKKKKIPCTECDKEFPPNIYKRHLTKHKKEALQEKHNVTKNKDEPVNKTEELPAEDRIPCDQCGKMLPKNAMKRHLMKHEIVTQETDNEQTKSVTEVTETDGSKSIEVPIIAEDAEKGPKVSNSRKKVPCVECGQQLAPNVIKRHIEKHKKEQEKQQEMYAPIEITPTKEFWEYSKDNKSSKSIKSDLKKPVDNTSVQEDITPSKKGKESKKERSKNKKEQKQPEEVVNKTVNEIKEVEKAKNSEDESESETPLEAAVRKVVSYRMTPKQALSIYNLTPKVLFDNLLGETDKDRMAILSKVDLSIDGEKKVIAYCKENEQELSYKAVINCVRELKMEHDSDSQDFSLSRLEAYRWWYAFRKKFDLKITAKKK